MPRRTPAVMTFTARRFLSVEGFGVQHVGEGGGKGGCGGGRGTVWNRVRREVEKEGG